jgi:hypothetical protein
MTSSVGGLVVGVEASRIGAVLDLAEVTDHKALLDVARIWGVASPDDEGRRVLEISTDSGSRLQLLVGQTLELRSVEHGAFCHLPSLIEEAARDVGIASFFVIETDSFDPTVSRLGFVVDVDRLGERK